MAKLNGYYYFECGFHEALGHAFSLPSSSVYMCVYEREQNVCAKENYRGRDLLALSSSSSSSSLSFQFS